MALTDIGSQKTPGRPIEITFAPFTGLPGSTQNLVLIGQMGPTGGPSGGGTASGTSSPYTAVVMSNVVDPTAAATEAGTKFGVGSELAKMVIAAVKANQGNANFPPITCIPLAESDTTWANAFNALNSIEAEFVAGPFDGATDSANRSALQTQMLSMSGPQRVENSQFGSIGVLANFSVTDPSTLPKPDGQWLSLAWLRDTSGNAYSVGEFAAAYAAIMAGGSPPFPPLRNVPIGSLPAPALQADWIKVGAGMESEVALNQGWSPIRVLPNGTTAIVRTVTTRVTVGDGVTPAQAYYDVQDFQILYYFRRTVFFRVNQPDFSNAKASQTTAQNLKAEMIRLAQAFQDQQMFQAVAQLGAQFAVERNASDRTRFDVFIPVNVVPGLQVIATNIQAGTQFDNFTV